MGTYSTGFTAEAQKVHGEALQARIFARKTIHPYGISNYITYREWALHTYNFYPTALPTNWGYITGATPTFPNAPDVTPIPDQFYAVNATARAFPFFGTNPGDLQEYDTLMWSCYIHSASTIGTSNIAGIMIRTFTGNTEIAWSGDSAYGEENMNAYIDVDGSGNLTLQVDPWEPSILDIGITDVGSGWSRVWIYAEQPELYRDSRMYHFRVSSAYSAGNPVSLFFDGPMVQLEPTTTGSPATFKVGKEIFHPGDLVEIGDYTQIVSINPIVRKREREFGVVQGSSVQIQISNVDLETVDQSLVNACCYIDIGFPTADEWETVYHGKVKNVKTNTNLTAVLEIEDPIMELLEGSLSRPIGFQNDTAYVSAVEEVDIADGSGSYSATPNVINSFDYSIKDQTYTIKFLSEDTFSVCNEKGFPLGNISTFENIFETGSTAEFTAEEVIAGPIWGLNNALQIPSNGWEGTFVAGDTYQFHVSRARTIGETSTYGIVEHLITDVAGLNIYDVENDVYFSSPYSNLPVFSGYITGDTGQVNGVWDAGSKYIDMIQEALKLTHSTIFPSKEGLIEFHSPDMLETGTTTINGDPRFGNISIISGEIEDNLDDYANIVTVNYKSYTDGADKSISKQASVKANKPTEKVITTKWGVTDAAANTCASRGLYRFNGTRRVYSIDSTLANLTLDITYPANIIEPFLNISNDTVTITEKQIDINNQAVRLIGWNDPFSSLNIARVGYSHIDDTDKVVW